MMADKLSGQAQVQPPDDATTIAQRHASSLDPVWLWDPRRNRIVWANEAAARFWEAGSVLDLIEYRFVASSPEARLGSGQRGSAERVVVLAPNGEPLKARLRVDFAALFDGSEGLLVRVLETLAPSADAALESKANLFDAAPVALLMVDHSGTIRHQNVASSEIGSILPADLLENVAAQALTRGSANRSFDVPDSERERSFRLHATRLENEPGVIVRIDEVTDRRALERITEPEPDAKKGRCEEPKESQKAAAHLIASLSHEMRNPLNAILGFSEIMQQRRFGPLGNHRYEGYVDDIHMSAAHLLQLVNDLLDMGKLAEGKFKIDFEAVSLAAVAVECSRMLQMQADEKGVSLELTVASTLPPVVADKRAMRQLVLNVLSNAVRFTQAGGAVRVSGGMDSEGGVRLTVCDTGVGMTEEELARAMEPYGQIDNALQNRSNGTGLGLPLAKALAEANKCEFHIKSTPMKGTEVELLFSPARVLAG